VAIAPVIENREALVLLLSFGADQDVVICTRARFVVTHGYHG
jgi:hypothetical protein